MFTDVVKQGSVSRQRLLCGAARCAGAEPGDVRPVRGIAAQGEPRCPGSSRLRASPPATPVPR